MGAAGMQRWQTTSDRQVVRDSTERMPAAGGCLACLGEAKQRKASAAGGFIRRSVVIRTPEPQSAAIR